MFGLFIFLLKALLQRSLSWAERCVFHPAWPTVCQGLVLSPESWGSWKIKWKKDFALHLSLPWPDKHRTGNNSAVFHPAQTNLQSWESITHPFSFLPVHTMTVLQAKPHHSWGASVKEVTTGVFGKKLVLVLQWEGHVTCNLGQHSPRSGVYRYLLASWPAPGRSCSNFPEVLPGEQATDIRTVSGDASSSSRAAPLLLSSPFSAGMQH